MRATRAYIAGFGTAGSLLAGAAALFVLATAVVAFNGWPQLSTVPAPPTVLAASVRTPGDSAVSRRIQLAARATAPAPATAAPAGGVVGGAITTGTIGTGTATTIIPQRTTGGTPATRTRTVPVRQGSHPCTDCGSSVTGTVGSTITQATAAIGGTVTQGGHTLGDTVTNAGDGVAKAVEPISPPLAGAVGGTGSALGNTIDQAAGVVGSILKGTGQALGTSVTRVGQSH
jgi:hypothetical protein